MQKVFNLKKKQVESSESDSDGNSNVICDDSSSEYDPNEEEEINVLKVDFEDRELKLEDFVIVRFQPNKNDFFYIVKIISAEEECEIFF